MIRTQTETGREKLMIPECGDRHTSESETETGRQRQFRARQGCADRDVETEIERSIKLSGHVLANWIVMAWR